MKKIAVVVAVLVAVLVAAILILPSLVPAEKIRDELVAQVKAATGRDLSIQGKVAVSVFPSLSVQVGNVALSNPPGYTGKDLLRLGALDVKLKLMPLLSGRVEVDSFVLIEPFIALETDRQGRGNWTFDTGAKQPAAKPAEKQAAPAAGGGGAPLSDVRLGDVRISGGKLVYVDGKTGARQEVSDINLTVSLPSLDAPLAAKGGLKWQGKTIDLALDVAKPRALLDGAVTEAGVSVSAEPVKLAFKGQVDAGKGAVGGDVDLGVPSIRGLVLWTTGKPLDAPGTGLGPLSVKGKLAAGAGKVSFTQAAIAVDAIKATGDVAVDGNGSVPAVKGRLDVETLDLNPYLPPEGQQAAKPAQPAAKGKSDWSDDPIDASGLKAVELDFALSVQAIKVRAIQVGKSALKLAIHGGRMTADLTELALYNGSGKGRLGVDGSQPGVGLDAAFTLAGLKAEPFLKDAAGFDRLDGTAAFDVQVAGRGRSQRQLVSALDGKGKVTFLDGAIKGINLAAMVRNVTTAFTDSGAAQKTDFAELSGSFVI
ncbi:MAG: AsmA family protein, partial [Actinomycetota bacterium]